MKSYNNEKAIIDIIRSKKQYKIWKEKILKRDNYECQYPNCKLKGCSEVHHKKELYVIIDEKGLVHWEDCINCKDLWDLGNGITYCQFCHKLIHYNHY